MPGRISLATFQARVEALREQSEAVGRPMPTPAVIPPTSIEATREEALRYVNVEGLLAEPKPFVRFIPGFGDSSLDFTLVVHVRNYVDQFYVQHDLRKRIIQRFQKERIEFAFPTRTLVLDKSPWPVLRAPAGDSGPPA